MEYNSHCPPRPATWIGTLLTNCKRYVFPSRAKRREESGVQPKLSFVLARHKNGLYRFGTIVGKDSKEKAFVIQFIHRPHCETVSRQHILVNHGNLLSLEVSFLTKKKRHRYGIVYGNNAPSKSDGLPTLFYIRPLKAKRVWYKISRKDIFLTHKQFVRACMIKRIIKNC